MHYHLIVIGNGSLRDMMAPFSENLEVPEYCVGEVPQSDLHRFLDYYNENIKGRHFSSADFDELYALKGEDWNDNRWRKNSKGVWCEYSTWNPNSKWDWYEVGGRWPGQLQIKEGVEYHRGVQFSRGWSEEDKRDFFEKHPRCADVALKKDIANIDELTAYSILKDGEWIETDEFNSTLKVADYLEDVSDDTLITSVDYHF